MPGRTRRACDGKQRWKAYLSHWENRRLSSIKQADVRAWHLKMKATPYVANRAVALLRSMYNLAAAELGYKGENPARGIKKYKEASRDRFYARRIARIFPIARQRTEPDHADVFCRVALHRRPAGNICAMRWDQIDLATSTWRIPDTKRGEPQVVPLLPAALDALLAIREKAVDGWVFPARNRRGTIARTLPTPCPHGVGC